MADQGVAALTPLLAVGLLARLLPAEAFGAYVLIGTATAGGLAVLGAVVLDPLAARGRGRPVDHALAALALLALGLAGVPWLLLSDGAPAGLAAAAPLALLVLARREAHRRGRPGRALGLGLLWLAGGLGGLGALALLGHLSPGRAVAGLALAAGLAALPGLAGWPWAAVRRRGVWAAAWARHRGLGGWLLLAVPPWWLAAQAPLVALALWHGEAAAGGLRVLLLAAAPVALLTAGVGTLMQPRLARCARAGGTGARAAVRGALAVGAGLGSLGLLWLGVALLLPGPLVTLVGGAEWSGLAPLTAAAAALAAGKALAAGPDLAVRARRDGRTTALATTAGAAAGGLACLIAVPVTAVAGALAALAIASAAAAAVQGLGLWRAIRNAAPPEHRA